MRAGWAALALLCAGAQEKDPAAPAEFKVKFETSKGDFVVKVTRDWAPRGADRFHALVKAQYFDGARFYRVLPKYVAQFGYHADPKVSAAWREKAIEDDAVKEKNIRGTLTYAKSGADSRTTQMFINLKDNPALDKQGFAPFATVIEGMEIVDQLHSGYGEGAPKGRGPSQERIFKEGNAYLEKSFKDLDHIKSARLAE